MGDISRRALLGATGGLIAGGLLKTQADALTMGEEAAGLQTAQADPTKILGAPTSVLGQRAPAEQPRRVMGGPPAGLPLYLVPRDPLAAQWVQQPLSHRADA